MEPAFAGRVNHGEHGQATIHRDTAGLRFTDRPWPVRVRKMPARAGERHEEELNIVHEPQGAPLLPETAASPARRHCRAPRAVRWRSAFAVLALLAAGAAPAAPAAVPAERVEDAVKRVLDSGNYQRELPLPGAAARDEEQRDDPMADPDWWRNEGDTQAPDLYRPGRRGTDSTGFQFDIPPALREVLRVLMWIVFVAGGGLVAYYLLNEARLFSRWKRGGWQTEDGSRDAMTSGPRADAAGPEDPESLAARGEFAEAVHALLLRSIMLIRQRGVALSTSLTSREILRRAPLGDHEKEAFRALVDMAELTHFGGRGANEADFQQCRTLFQRIARSDAGGIA